MDPDIIANCHFAPISAIKKTIDFKEPIGRYYNGCTRNVWKMQQKYTRPGRCNRKISVWRFAYHIAIQQAICAHDWNKLLFLLKSWPIWEHLSSSQSGVTFYVRALTILLMYHPTCQAKSLLKEYLHMVSTCRTEEEKKAVLKIICSLPDKFRMKTFPFMKYRKNLDSAPLL